VTAAKAPAREASLRMRELQGPGEEEVVGETAATNEGKAESGEMKAQGSKTIFRYVFFF
jgi:hypothetical protein